MTGVHVSDQTARDRLHWLVEHWRPSSFTDEGKVTMRTCDRCEGLEKLSMCSLVDRRWSGPRRPPCSKHQNLAAVWYHDEILRATDTGAVDRGQCVGSSRMTRVLMPLTEPHVLLIQIILGHCVSVHLTPRSTTTDGSWLVQVWKEKPQDTIHWLTRTMPRCSLFCFFYKLHSVN